jgi:hypothetical protein
MLQNSGQERDVILRRFIAELEMILVHQKGLTVRELTRMLAARDPGLQFNEQTIRRDCRTLEYQGWVDPRDEEEERRGIAWRVKASTRLRSLIR